MDPMGYAKIWKHPIWWANPTDYFEKDRLLWVFWKMEKPLPKTNDMSPEKSMVGSDVFPIP